MNVRKGGVAIKELHVISTGQQTRAQFVSIIKDIHPYIDFVHLREPSWTDNEMIEAINLLIEEGVPRNKLVVNTRVNIAHVMKTYGIQLTNESMDVTEVKKFYRHLRVGCSVHSVKEAIDAAGHGADYLIYGHIFETGSKRGIAPRGVKQLEEVTHNTTAPVIAIGGITPENTQLVLQSGASGIAVLSGILLARDPLQAVKRYQECLAGGIK
ncbi:thiazole tautomerase TenI [Lentibacillus cibarius]|uniref:Thiazole tautomerase TenI n=1 Tax=Lentibacillus cibarius TaxID=2583219 RepID=A0A549YL82_9BACI|nr:thiazole tautomerase TenI [Lentibacillus cibarius]